MLSPAQTGGRACKRPGSAPYRVAPRAVPRLELGVEAAPAAAPVVVVVVGQAIIHGALGARTGVRTVPAPRCPQPLSPERRHPQRRPGGQGAALCPPLPLCPPPAQPHGCGSALRAPGSPLPGSTCGGLAPTGQELAWGASGPCRPGPGKQDPSLHEDGLPAQGKQPGGGHAGPRGCSQGHRAAPEDAARARRTLVPDPDGVRGLLPLPGAPAAKGGAATDLKGPGRSNYCFPRACGPADDRVRGRTECHYDH